MNLEQDYTLMNTFNDPECAFSFLIFHKDTTWHYLPTGIALAYYYAKEWHEAETKCVINNVYSWMKIDHKR